MNAAHYRLLIETTHDDNQSLWSANGLGWVTPNLGFDGHLVGDTEQRALDSVHGSVKQSKKPWPDAGVDWRNDVCSAVQIASALSFFVLGRQKTSSGCAKEISMRRSCKEGDRACVKEGASGEKSSWISLGDGVWRRCQWMISDGSSLVSHWGRVVGGDFWTLWPCLPRVPGVGDHWEVPQIHQAWKSQSFCRHGWVAQSPSSANLQEHGARFCVVLTLHVRLPKDNSFLITLRLPIKNLPKNICSL